MRIGAVIVNYDSHRLLERNFQQLAHAGNVDISVTIVDNFSSDGERASVSALAESQGWTCLHNPNTGYGEGMNLGAAAALAQGCDVLLLVNPDLEIEASQVLELARQAMRGRSLVAPLIMDSRSDPWGRLGFVDVARGRAWSRGGEGELHTWLSGACLAVSASTWERVGGFDPDYFMYWEDVDLSVRCHEVGVDVTLLDSVVVTHHVGGTQGRGRSRLYYFYNCRNRLVFASKHLSGRAQLRWLVLTAADVRRVVVRDPMLTRWGRLVHAVPPCLTGVASGMLWMLRSEARRVVRRGDSMEGHRHDG